MPIYDYALLALLASGGQGLDGLTLTLGPDAIVQPKGGGLVLLVKDAAELRLRQTPQRPPSSM